jgi:TPR repeat protein
MIDLAVIVLAAAMLFQSGGATAKAPSSQQATQKTAKDDAIQALTDKAAAGDVQSQVRLGLAYVTGDGVAHDDAEAVKWFRKAADQDDMLGERYLAEMYFKGRGVAADNAEAAKWLRLAAGQDDPESEHNLAVMYLQGLGVPRNGAEALKWMHKSADHGLADGQVGLGAMYEVGDGVRLDEVESAKWYRKAAEQDSREGLNDLALLELSAKNMSLRNPKEAVTLATKAAGNGDNPGYLDTLAKAYYETNQYRQAIDAERKALTLDAGNEAYQKALDKYLAAVGEAR